MRQNAPTNPLTTGLVGTSRELSLQVASALARLATLQGHPTTQHEFESLAPCLDHRALDGIPLAGRIGVLWQARFPQTRFSAPSWPPSPDDLPALWLGASETGVEVTLLIVIGALTNGALSCLDSQGNSVLLEPHLACCGQLLVLKPGACVPDLERPHGRICLAEPADTRPREPTRRLWDWMISRLRKP
jgi:hypothetical protein